MRTIFLLLILTSETWSATVTVCASGCTTTSLQTALDSTALCGDTIQIKSAEIQTAIPGGFTLKNRGCSSGAPITVTTDRAAWLPIGGARITPSHQGNMAVIRTADTSPALTSVLTAGVPAAHWIFDGINFTTSNVGSYTHNIILSKSYVAASAAEIPDDITFIRCLWSTPLPNGTVTGVDVTNALYGEISNLTIKDSFVGDIAKPGQETHGFGNVTTPGPLKYQNNFITTAGMPIFVGGTITDYPVTPANITFQYNYTWRPWKWLSDAANPFIADYNTNKAGNGGVGYNPCLKNHGELKYADGLTWRYNGHENMWSQVQCFSQYNGFTNTMRTGWEASFQNATMGSMTMSDTTHVAWSGSYNIADSTNNGLGLITNMSRGICINFSSGVGIECRPVTSYNNTAKTAIVTTAFSAAPGGGMQWWVIYDAQQQLRDVSIQNNVFKNMAKGVNSLGLDPGNGAGNAGKMTGSIVRNNLFWNYNSFMEGGGVYGVQGKGWTFTCGEESFAVDCAAYILDHNTLYAGATIDTYLGFAAVGNATLSRQPLWQSMQLTNNLAGPGATYSVVGDGTTGNLDLTMSTYTGNSSLKNNGMPGVSTSACTGSNTCSGNIGSTWSDPFASSRQGIFKVRPGMIYSKAATSQNDIGVSFDQLPLITSVKVNSTSKAGLLEFDLSGPIADSGNTQPCVLEVSSSRNLHSDLNTYTVTNDLNPTFFQQPDTSARANTKLLPVLVANRHVSWPIGQEAAVLGDDGQTHDLRLLPSTVYYGRLMCYGDTEWFTFSTAPISSSSVRYPLTANLRIGAPPGTTIVRLSYGPSSALGASVDFPTGTNVSLPLTSGALTYYKLQYLSGSQILYTSAVSSLLGGQ